MAITESNTSVNTPPAAVLPVTSRYRFFELASSKGRLRLPARVAMALSFVLLSWVSTIMSVGSPRIPDPSEPCEHPRPWASIGIMAVTEAT